jgi:hypothetical protein
VSTSRLIGQRRPLAFQSFPRLHHFKLLVVQSSLLYRISNSAKDWQRSSHLT